MLGMFVAFFGDWRSCKGQEVEFPAEKVGDAIVAAEWNSPWRIQSSSDRASQVTKDEKGSSTYNRNDQRPRYSRRGA
jgi:hypothetical protein